MEQNTRVLPNMLLILVVLHLVAIEGQIDDVATNEYPYAAFLSVQCLSQNPNASTSWRCGASIVTQYLLLTAAHCVDPSPCDEISIGVTVGQTDKHKGSSVSVHSYMIHEEYGPKYRADIALVRLITALDLNTQVSRVALMPNPPTEEVGLVVGWNQNLPIENITNDFNYFLQHVWKKEDCSGIMEDLPIGTFCAKANNSDYTFNSYSGSAHTIYGYIQIGICSYVEPRPESTVFIFTDVTFYYEWIRDNTVTIMCKKQDLERLQGLDFNQTVTNDEFNQTISNTDSNQTISNDDANQETPNTESSPVLPNIEINPTILVNDINETISVNETEIGEKILLR